MTANSLASHRVNTLFPSFLSAFSYVALAVLFNKCDYNFAP